MGRSPNDFHPASSSQNDLDTDQWQYELPESGSQSELPTYRQSRRVRKPPSYVAGDDAEDEELHPSNAPKSFADFLPNQFITAAAPPKERRGSLDLVRGVARSGSPRKHKKSESVDANVGSTAPWPSRHGKSASTNIVSSPMALSPPASPRKKRGISEPYFQDRIEESPPSSPTMGKTVLRPESEDLSHGRQERGWAKAYDDAMKKKYSKDYYSSRSEDSHFGGSSSSHFGGSSSSHFGGASSSKPNGDKRGKASSMWAKTRSKLYVLAESGRNGGR